ncbi:MAG: biliverdin-producing heme oxygenase [Acetobacter persici]|uniref:biliverdin-producing heme oxygenase n=1 Tax=Acetobacter persici TaxID=1076596 RepID=UPI0039EB0A2E
MARDTRRFFLRDRTHSDHTELDQLIGPLTSETAYRRYLKSLAGFRAGAEQAVSKALWPESLTGWSPVSLGRMMQADLHDLEESTTPLPPFPTPVSVPALLGALYVLEGSSLGARFLAKQVATLGYSQDFGARHLAVQTASPDNWQHFLHRLDASSEWDAEEAAGSARTFFQYALHSVRHTDSLTAIYHG